jgi:type II secretory pathway pseudopilin PulG
MNNKSFTMIELIVAMSIVLIISIIGTINYLRSYDTLKLDAAAQRIASDIRYAQSLVMDRNAQSRKATGAGNCLVVDFNIGNNCYHVVPNQQPVATCLGPGADSPIIYAPITDPLTKETLELHFNTNNEYKGVAISLLSFGGESSYHAISFSDPGGEVNTGYWECQGSNAVFTEIPLPSIGGTITLSYRNKTKTIKISQTIGRVTIE